MQKIVLLISVLFSSVLTAQTKFTVIVTNGNFNPSNLTIAIGDTVEFVNQAGVHWIDGRTATYPSNPVSFDNQSQSGSGWTYKQVFNTGGFYDYRCGIHTTTMFGTITVQFPTGINDFTNKEPFTFFPNPATNTIYFSPSKKINRIIVYTITGEEVFTSNIVDNQLSLSSLAKGMYFLTIIGESVMTTQKLMVQSN